MRAARFLALLGVLTGSACISFVNPVAKTVSFVTPPPTPAPAPPSEGYLRIYVTSNLSGIHKSWTSAEARSQFKQLLVTLQLNPAPEKVPIANFDITASTSADMDHVDVAHLSYVKFDDPRAAEGRRNSGLSQNPDFMISVQAVPFTLADVASKLVEFAKSVSKALPPGTSIATTFASGGTADLVQGLLGTIETQADKYKDRKWIRSKQVTVYDQLKQPGGMIAYVLVPDESQDPPPAAGTANPPPAPVPIEIPPLYACGSGGNMTGTLSHLCTRDGVATALYDKLAWFTLQFEVLDAPPDDSVPQITNCAGDLPKDDWFAQYTRDFDKFSLSTTHRDQLNRFREQITAAHQVAKLEGVNRLGAWVEWHVAAGSPPQWTWPGLKARAEQVSGCIGTLASGQQAWLSVVAKDVAIQLKAIREKGTPDVDLAYRAIDSMRAALVGLPTEGGLGNVLGQVNQMEAWLYRAVFAPLNSREDVERMMQKFPRCEYCRDAAKRQLETLPQNNVKMMPPPRAAGFEGMFSLLNLDPQPILDVEKTAQAYRGAAQGKDKKTIEDARVLREKAITTAAALLTQRLGFTQEGAEIYLRRL